MSQKDLLKTIFFHKYHVADLPGLAELIKEIKENKKQNYPLTENTKAVQKFIRSVVNYKK
ncbi:hypothetical protein [Desulforamulus hydrothermalis]|uniref:Uncharacterized protein n=1 Tax=Desulforamulus hydrothermalis Lam5 = DSM 18033 TaxID=1121428 RepID=K8EFD9_9FIRM|nr:hypothetical protein [Desulforamulus hydrothermalis]CCO07386.1 hypothetical protein DESHY_110330 [Desulforamulus hydrothermalis Lam5 = DSM 18033]SHH41425.1 hypothetical protein SAMN02745177_02473 [Desulforamulus hydrothermalis Lam5 = DSM 18033]